MKKKIISIYVLCMMVLMVTGCGKTDSLGVWYIVDENNTMINFQEDNKVDIGGSEYLYDQEGDSIILSVPDGDSTQNYEMVIKKTEYGESLVTEDGNIYACRDLEKAQQVVLDYEELERQALDADRTKLLNYYNNNVVGTWICDDENSSVSKITFSKNKIEQVRYGEVETSYWFMDEGSWDDDRLGIRIADDKTGKNGGTIYCFADDAMISKNQMMFYTSIFTKVK